MAEFQQIPYVFQPIVDATKGNRVIGYEALIRPVGMTPVEYIQMKTKEGSLESVEFETFVNSIRQFKDRGLKGRLFINSFPYIMLEKNKLSYIKELAGDMYRDIFVENLEYGIVVDKAKLAMKYESIRDMGFRVVLDDFGSGINSIAALKAITPEIVKIDRSFISGCTRDLLRKNTVEIVADVIKNHGAKALAEGIETHEEYEFIKSLDIGYMQGFYLGRPG